MPLISRWDCLSCLVVLVNDFKLNSSYKKKNDKRSSPLFGCEKIFLLMTQLDQMKICFSATAVFRAELNDEEMHPLPCEADANCRGYGVSTDTH